jgi:hypothetical protein
LLTATIIIIIQWSTVIGDWPTLNIQSLSTNFLTLLY